jgi:hypothetical protein
MKKLQAKYDKRMAEIKKLQERVSSLEQENAESERLQQIIVSQLTDSSSREEKYSRIITYLKERDYRFSQSTTPPNRKSRDIEGMTAALNTPGYADVIRWVNIQLRPESIIARLTEDRACDEAIKKEANALRAIIERPVPDKINEVIADLQIPATPVVNIVDTRKLPQPGTRNRVLTDHQYIPSQPP